LPCMLLSAAAVAPAAASIPTAMMLPAPANIRSEKNIAYLG
jgi:hypothetical protein